MFKELVLSSLVWTSISRIAAVAFVAVFNWLLVRNLAIEEVGAFFLFYSVAVLGPQLQLLGFNLSLLKHVERVEPGKTLRLLNGMQGGLRKLVGLIPITSLMLGFVTSYFISIEIHRFEDRALIAIVFSVWLFTACWRLLSSSALKGSSHFAAAAIIENIVFNAFAILGVVVAFEVADIRTIEAALIICCVASLLPVFFKRSLQVLRVIFSSPAALEHNTSSKTELGLVRYSLGLMLVAIFPVALNQGALWAVAFAGTASDVAIYGLGFRVVQVIVFPAMVATLFIRPFLSDHPQFNTKLQGLLGLVAIVVTFLLLVGAGGFMLLDDWIVSTLFGEDYRLVIPLVLILLLGRVASALFGPSDLLMSFRDNTFVVLVVSVISVSLVVSALSLTPVTMFSVAVGVSVVLAIRSICLWVACKKKTGIDTSVFSFSRNSFSY